MDQTLVKRLGLSMDQWNKLPVMVANGDRIECIGKCMGLTLTVQNCPVRSDFYVLPVAACSIVLGVQWLETLGPVETDYRKLTMKFKLDDRPYQLQGIHDGVSVDRVKIKVVISWPRPTTTKGVCGFLGLAGYYRKFISGFGGIAAPLNKLLSKTGFHWDSNAEEAFTRLKTMLTTPPVLRLPDFT
ncbi:hypothetical protein FEM48_Zijuj03G0170300 [Ziziphus jujuba var. spinosa]|uniref:Mitochondrial protein n=1 Tax=Ziziphus jujuba var. spinosa TaxID=714518 RepID=A0A978VRJ2_ZIZJJ|nr:hypothetical protein FEM48_Zijuj03G0170300 [Ziziphus jujuba var. spinosa]